MTHYRCPQQKYLVAYNARDHPYLFFYYTGFALAFHDFVSNSSKFFCFSKATFSITDFLRFTRSKLFSKFFRQFPYSLSKLLLFSRYVPVTVTPVFEFICGALLPQVYEFAVARFCHESMAVCQPGPSTKSSTVASIKCGPDLPANALDQSRYPHHFDSRDDGRVDPSVPFALSETFRCLETAYQSGHIGENDYPAVLEEASQLYLQLQ